MKNYSVEPEARGNAGSQIEVKTLMAVTEKQQVSKPRIEEGHKLVRRYSFDDNGGGYLGL